MSFRPAPTLFITQFAAMAGFLAPVPVLPQIARDLGVSIAAAGQLRTLSGLAAGVVALAAGVLAHRLGVRRLLLAGLCLIAFGSAMSAVAPSFVVLAAAQPPLGAGIAMVLAGGWSAAAAWAPAADRARLLAWAIIGQPAALGRRHAGHRPRVRRQLEVGVGRRAAGVRRVWGRGRRPASARRAALLDSPRSG